ncbi:MAG: MotA/TolQ/ExbB proton channel family protein [Bdellovibrionia bacterium]
MAIVQAFQEGGPFMFVILALAIFTFTFVAERSLFLYRKVKATPAEFRQKVSEFIGRGDFRGAEAYALSTQTSVGAVTAAGFKARVQHGGDELVQARMDEQLNAEIHNIDRRTGFLAMFGNVATLVGLLGTIAGMIHSFAAVAQANPMDRATLLSKGISEAMNCTAFGLIVAVPALVCYAVFQNKTEKIVNDITDASTQIYHDIVFYVDRGTKAAVSAQVLRATTQRQIEV